MADQKHFFLVQDKQTTVKTIYFSIWWTCADSWVCTMCTHHMCALCNRQICSQQFWCRVVVSGKNNLDENANNFSVVITHIKTITLIINSSCIESSFQTLNYNTLLCLHIFINSWNENFDWKSRNTIPWYCSSCGKIIHIIATTVSKDNCNSDNCIQR